jgi:4-hydroxy-tetrahydrodipicolinate synthase
VAAVAGESTRIRGVLTPVVTPFDRAREPDAARLVRQCRWLLSQDVGRAVFGTNSEANSLSVGEKMRLLDGLVAADIPPSRMMPGTGASAFPDAVELTRHAVKLGCAGVLMLPPFYYKGVSDEGLFRYFAEIIERVGDSRLRIYVYHIPPVSQVPISLPLIARLLQAYPGIVAGVKDSSGNWDNTKAMLEQFQPQGFDVFAGSESFLLATLRGGGVGCISATANVNPGPIARLAATWQQDDADAQQKALNAVRDAFQKFPMIPALKAAVAHYGADPQWAAVRPPLVELDAAQRDALLLSLRELGFTMPGLGR